jgi:hypothetical protein
MFDQCIHIVVVEVVADQAQVGGCLLLQLVLEEQLEQLDVFDDGVDVVAVETERFF